MVNKKIASILRTIENSKCLEKAKQLEVDGFKTSTLNLRDLNLKINDITAISAILKHEDPNNTIKSISFSYNTLIGDKGATILAKSLPKSLSEIGLVDCGITDKGGSAILNWMKKATHLSMICMEDNLFSDGLKMEFNTFKKAHPNILVVF